MNGACKLNNKSMRGIRRDASYQCMVIDLAMLGVISKEECEMLIGAGIPKGLILPNGKNDLTPETPVEPGNEPDGQEPDNQETDNEPGNEPDNQEIDNQDTGNEPETQE